MSAFKLPFIRPGRLEIPTQERMPLAGRADLGPFDPPADYAFEPELLPPVPRPTPPRTWQRHHERQRTWNAIAFVVFGVTCFFCAERGIEPRLGKMVVSLSYLPWIGAGLMTFGALGLARRRVPLGPFRYVRHGAALVARVTGLATTPTLLVDGQPLYCAITGLVEYRDPQTGEVRSQELKSPEFQAARNDEPSITFHVGDYVTAAERLADSAASEAPL